MIGRPTIAELKISESKEKLVNKCEFTCKTEITLRKQTNTKHCEKELLEDQS